MRSSSSRPGGCFGNLQRGLTPTAVDSHLQVLFVCSVRPAHTGFIPAVVAKYRVWC